MKKRRNQSSIPPSPEPHNYAEPAKPHASTWACRENRNPTLRWSGRGGARTTPTRRATRQRGVFRPAGRARRGGLLFHATLICVHCAAHPRFARPAAARAHGASTRVVRAVRAHASMSAGSDRGATEAPRSSPAGVLSYPDRTRAHANMWVRRRMPLAPGRGAWSPVGGKMQAIERIFGDHD